MECALLCGICWTYLCVLDVTLLCEMCWICLYLCNEVLVEFIMFYKELKYISLVGGDMLGKLIQLELNF